MQQTGTHSAVLLLLNEIAAWQVPCPPAKMGPVVAALPALQRGAVWKVRQIEELWDSILRRFPIGAFVIAPPNEALKRKNFKLQSDQQPPPEPSHLLLDGQQRATGIALGFLDIWADGIEDAKSAIWVELAPPPQNRDVDFVFRVVTRSHPWGYKRNDPDSPLSAHQIRLALQAFRNANRMGDARPESFKLSQTWPWDSEAPVPLAMLIGAVSQTQDLASARELAWKRIQALPLFNQSSSATSADPAQAALAKEQDTSERQRAAIRQAFEDESSLAHACVNALLQRMRSLISEENPYRVPALPLDFQDSYASVHASPETVAAPSAPEDAARKDAIELLFVRVNSAGSPLEGEELTYSLLKAAWPDAAHFIDGLNNKPAQASRIATLCTRLTLARRQASEHAAKKPTLPPTPGVSEFRRLVRNQSPAHPAFFGDLTQFIEHGANELFDAAWHFLTSQSFGLLPFLAVDLAQKSHDVYFLLLRWLDRLQQAGVDPMALPEETQRRTLGFLTALAWFAHDDAKACASLWPMLQGVPDGIKLETFFDRAHFSKTCRVDARFNFRMLPLPTVDQLELACKRGVTGHPGCQATISKANSPIWSEWEWDTSFSAQLVKDQDVRTQWTELLKPENGAFEDQNESFPTTAAIHFANRLWGSRQVLLYAQREWLQKWYPGFDPSLPENMEDKNRPWDYDHILPQNLMRTDTGGSRRSIPAVIWDWFGSIGNFRAWPLEANRSDRDINPSLKLEEINEEEQRYGITDGPTKRAASFVHEELDWPLWEKCVPMTDDGRVEDGRYLAKSDYHEYRQALVKAIVRRFIELYRSWYDALRIADLH